MLTVEMLPAKNGDCLWVEYGSPGERRRLLIDGGTHATYDALRERIEALPPHERTFELLVVTHIDNDHIDGIVRLLQNPQLGFRFKDIWFNGWRHLRAPEDDVLGPVQAEYLAARIRHRRLAWNRCFEENFDEDAVVVPPEQKLPRIPLAGDLELVLLSPTPAELTRLRGKWRDVVTDVEKDYPDPGSTADWLRRLDRDRRYRPDDDFDDTLGPERPPNVEKLLQVKFESDNTPANGSSIAFLLKHGVKHCLFGGDAHAPVLEASIRRYLAEEGLPRLPLDGFKVPHHGSKKNVSKSLLDLLQCRRFLISTNSSGRQRHPDDESVARIVAYGGQDTELVFNYRVNQTKRWNNRGLRRKYGYRTRYPPAGREGISVEL
jgi:hypothetical protein